MHLLETLRGGVCPPSPKRIGFPCVSSAPLFFCAHSRALAAEHSVTAANEFFLESSESKAFSRKALADPLAVPVAFAQNGFGGACDAAFSEPSIGCVSALCLAGADCDSARGKGMRFDTSNAVTAHKRRFPGTADSTCGSAPARRSSILDISLLASFAYTALCAMSSPFDDGMGVVCR